MLLTNRPPEDTAPEPDAPSRRAVPGPVLPLAAAVVALAVSLFEIGRPSYWLDEAATVSAMRRPLPDLFRMFQEMDLVHACYYLLLWPWAHLFGTGETALRLPGALVTALAAAGVTVIGRRCAGKTAGLASGLVYASLVSVTRYAQEARSYAMVGAVAVLASYLLIRALEDNPDDVDAGDAGDEARKRRRWPWFTGYALAVVLLALLNLEAVLLVPAHLVTLAFSRTARGLWGRWLAASAVAGAALAPFAFAASHQDRQIDWLPKPGGLMLWRLVKFFAGDARLAAPVLGLALLGALVVWRREGTASLTALALPWLLLPSAVLLAWSWAGQPVFIFRYVFFSLPALALLVGAGLARLWRTGLRTSGRATGATTFAAGAVLLATLTVPAQAEIREQDSRLDDLRGAAQIIKAHGRKGDAIVYLAGVVRWGALAYPGTFGGLRDLGLAEDPVRAGNFTGRDKAPLALRPALLKSDRVWVMGSRSVPVRPGDAVERRHEVIAKAGPWKVLGTWRYHGGWLTLYERVPPVTAPPRSRPECVRKPGAKPKSSTRCPDRHRRSPKTRHPSGSGTSGPVSGTRR